LDKGLLFFVRTDKYDVEKEFSSLRSVSAFCKRNRRREETNSCSKNFRVLQLREFEYQTVLKECEKIEE